MYCQDCGMLKSNCVCGRYNKSDKNQEINEEAKAEMDAIERAQEREFKKQIAEYNANKSN